MDEKPLAWTFKGRGIRHARILNARSELESALLRSPDLSEGLALAVAGIPGERRLEVSRTLGLAMSNPVGWFSRGRPMFETACRMLRMASDLSKSVPSPDPELGVEKVPGVFRITAVRPALTRSGRYYDVRISCATGPLSGWGAGIRMSDKWLQALMHNALGGRKFNAPYQPMDALRLWFCAFVRRGPPTPRGPRGPVFESLEVVAGQRKYNRQLLAVRIGKCILAPELRSRYPALAFPHAKCSDTCGVPLGVCRYSRWPAEMVEGDCRACGRRSPIAVAGVCLQCVKHNRYREGQA